MFPEITRYLEQQGRSINGKLLYQLTWSGNAFELRRGVFNDFYGDIFVREFRGVRLVPKYPYIESRWILEKYFPPSVAFSEALPESNEGSYEPIFVFQDKNGNPLPVVLKVVEMLINYDRNQSKPSSVQRASEAKEAFEKLEEKEFNDILDSIDTSPIQSLLHTKEAIVKP